MTVQDCEIVKIKNPVDYSCSSHAMIESRVNRNEKDIKFNNTEINNMKKWVILSSGNLIIQLLIVGLLFALKLK